MPDGVLSELLAPDLQTRAYAISGATALRHFLTTRTEVRAVGDALRSGVITEQAVRRFTETLIRDLQRGILFEHDRTLAALAVALKDWHTPFSAEYLRGLADLEAAEMPYGPRVAREVLSNRPTSQAKSMIVGRREEPGTQPAVRAADLRTHRERPPTRAKNKANRIAFNGVG